MKYLSFAIFTIFTIFIVSSPAFADVDICKAVNSLNPYEKNNFSIVQTYFKNSYFPNIRVTGKNDIQTKFYIGKFQYAFGIKPTGVLNESTLILIRSLNGCFDLGERVSEIQDSAPVKKVDQDSLITDILVNFIYNSASTTTTQTASVTVKTN